MQQMHCAAWLVPCTPATAAVWDAAFGYCQGQSAAVYAKRDAFDLYQPNIACHVPREQKGWLVAPVPGVWLLLWSMWSMSEGPRHCAHVAHCSNRGKSSIANCKKCISTRSAANRHSSEALLRCVLRPSTVCCIHIYDGSDDMCTYADGRQSVPHALQSNSKAGKGGQYTQSVHKQFAKHT
jgi:hypothetical protein